jgi:hypothetical protein
MALTVADEMRRAMLNYVTPTYPEFAEASLNDLSHRYYEMRIGQLGLNRSLADLQRIYWNAGTTESINDAERRFYITAGGSPLKSTPDLEYEYWKAQP